MCKITRLTFQALLFIVCAVSLNLRAQSDLINLEKGASSEHQLAKFANKKFRFNLAAKQFVTVKIEQRGANVLARVFSPANEQIVEVNSVQARFGDEIFSFITAEKGEYQLEIQSRSKNEGKFHIEILEQREAEPSDEARVERERKVVAALLEASRLQVAIDNKIRLPNIEKMEQSLLMCRQMNEQAALATLLMRLGTGYSYAGDKQKALVYYTEAWQIRTSLGNRAEAAASLSDVATVKSATGEKIAALELYEQALKLYREVGDTEGEADVLTKIGNNYGALGEIQTQLDFYRQSLAVSQKEADEFNRAHALKNIGMAYLALNESQRALDYYEDALDAFRRAEDRIGEAECLNSIGMIHRVSGDAQKALDFHRQALTIWRETNRTLWQAAALDNIALVYESKNDAGKALEFYAESLRLRRQNGDYRRLAVGLDALGTAHRNLGEYEKASRNYQESLSFWEKSADIAGRAKTLDNIGKLYALRKNYAEAFRYFGQALEIWRGLKNRKEEAATLFLVALAERDKGDISAARKSAANILTIVEDFRTRIFGQDLRAAYFSSVQQYYDFYIELLMLSHEREPEANFDQAALLVNERARARSLLDLLETSRADLSEGIAPILLQKQRILRRQLHAKADRQIYLVTQPDALAKEGNALDAEIENLSKQYAETEKEIKKSNPRYAALTSAPTLTLSEIQKRLLDSDTMLLEYRLGTKRSFLWAVTKSEFRSYVLPNRGEIESAARRMIEALTARNKIVRNETAGQKKARIAEAEAAYKQAASDLSRMILTPLAEIKNVNRLAIIADGALQYIPFAALTVSPTDNGKQLLDNFEIVNLPSVSVLSAIRSESASRVAPPKIVAVFADPIFEADDPRLTALKNKLNASEKYRKIKYPGNSDEISLPRLFASREEAEAILSFTARGESTLLDGFQANEMNATSANLSEYRIVHFATHGILDASKPELSSLVLSLYDEKGNERDGFLRLHQIYNLNLPVELVVLSACQTALGKDMRGEGLIGLTRGFMYAGSRRVAASLWKVDDEATAELMKLFYRNHLQKNLAPAAALRAAQIEIQKNPRWQSPYFWSAFILQGEWK